MDDDDSDLELGKVLLKFKASIESRKHIKLFLGSRKKGPIFQGVPPTIVNGRDCVISEQQLDARNYAFVNKDAHSRSWRLAKSSTVRTCSRVMGG